MTYVASHVQYMLRFLCAVHVTLLMYSTCYASCVQYMLHFLCTVYGPRTDTDLDKRVGSEQEGKEANSRHRGVLRSDLGRFRTVETRQSVHESVMVHRNILLRTKDIRVWLCVRQGRIGRISGYGSVRHCELEGRCRIGVLRSCSQFRRRCRVFWVVEAVLLEALAT